MDEQLVTIKALDDAALARLKAKLDAKNKAAKPSTSTSYDSSLWTVLDAVNAEIEARKPPEVKAGEGYRLLEEAYADLLKAS